MSRLCLSVVCRLLVCTGMALLCCFSGLPASAASLAKIDPVEQSARDASRKQILEDELRDEFVRLSKAESALRIAQTQRKSPAEISMCEEDLARARANIEALRREIANLGDSSKAISNASKSSAPTLIRAKAPATKEGENATPWWDTYSRSILRQQ